MYRTAALLLLSLYLVPMQGFADDPPQVLGVAGGRFVLGQISAARADQYLIDTQTGEIWQLAQIVDAKGQPVSQVLIPIPRKGTEGAILQSVSARFAASIGDLSELRTKSAQYADRLQGLRRQLSSAVAALNSIVESSAKADREARKAEVLTALLSAQEIANDGVELVQQTDSSLTAFATQLGDLGVAADR